MATALIRTVILYLLLMLCLRLLGKRQIGELEPSELVLTMLLSDLAAVPMQDFGIPLLNGVVPILTLLSLSLLFSFLNMKSIRFRRLVYGEPTLLIDQGRLQQKAMQRNRFTLDELLEELRNQGIYDLSTVKYAILETNGELSVLLYEAQQPLTAAQLHYDIPDQVSLPRLIINDGHLLQDNLRRCKRDEVWLAEELKKRGYRSHRQVFLFSLDSQGNIFCIPKESGL